MEKNIRQRKWIISWNNYPHSLTLEELMERFKNKAKVEYCILGFEKGEIEHTPHIQGYIRFKHPQYFKSIRKLLINEDGTFGWIKKANGNDLQNREYCSKQNNFIEYGLANTDENEDISHIIDDIMEDMPYIELCQKYASYVLYHYRDFKQLYYDIKDQIKDIYNED